MLHKKLYPKVYLYRRIVQAKTFIDTNFAERIDLDNIANEANFSKFHFIRLFSNIYHQTPHQYLSSIRLARAKQLLAGGSPVAQTCYAVGFESVSSFTGLFKENTGQTPSAFQLRQLKKAKEISKAPLNFVPNCYAEKKGWRSVAYII